MQSYPVLRWQSVYREWARQDESVAFLVSKIAAQIESVFLQYRFFQEKGKTLWEKFEQWDFTVKTIDGTIGLEVSARIYAPQLPLTGNIEYYGLFRGNIFHYLALMGISADTDLWNNLLFLAHPNARKIVLWKWLPEKAVQNKVGTLSAVAWAYDHLDWFYAHEIVEILRNWKTPLFKEL